MSTFQIKTADEGSERPRRSQPQPQPEIQQPPDVPERVYKPDQPVAIERGDGEWQDWSRTWLAMINATPDIVTCEQWLAANGSALNQLEDNLLPHYQFVMREYNKRLRKLMPDDAA
jgi:hypothetical protein